MKRYQVLIYVLFLILSLLPLLGMVGAIFLLVYLPVEDSWVVTPAIPLLTIAALSLNNLAYKFGKRAFGGDQ